MTRTELTQLHSGAPMIVVVGLVAALAGCSRVVSRTWDDDPTNWERAFGLTEPPHVSVLHSRVTSRFPTWRYEVECYFQLAADPESWRQLLADHPFSRLEDHDAKVARNSEAPVWFAPRAAQRYDVWGSRGNRSTYLLFVDRGTGDVFLTYRRL